MNNSVFTSFEREYAKKWIILGFSSKFLINGSSEQPIRNLNFLYFSFRNHEKKIHDFWFFYSFFFQENFFKISQLFPQNLELFQTFTKNLSMLWFLSVSWENYIFFWKFGAFGVPKVLDLTFSIFFKPFQIEKFNILPWPNF